MKAYCTKVNKMKRNGNMPKRLKKTVSLRLKIRTIRPIRDPDSS